MSNIHDEEVPEDDCPPLGPADSSLQESNSISATLNSKMHPEELSRLVSEYLQDIGVRTLRRQISVNTEGKCEQTLLISASDYINNNVSPSEEIEILYKAPVGIEYKSQETIKTILLDNPEITDIPEVPVVAVPQVQNNFSMLPPMMMNKLVCYLNFRSLNQCRQVCKNWNQHISSSDHFLNRSVFVMGHNLDLVQLCKKTEVKWRNITCQLLPCPEFYSTRSYQQKFLVNKLIRGPKTFFTAGIHSITLDHIEVQKENLVKWLASCPLLKAIELKGCSFKKTRVRWTNETLLKIAERLKEIKVHDMSLCNLVDFGKLILMFTKKLTSLEISQKGVDTPISEVPPLRVKTLEEDMVSILSLTMERNAKSLKSLGISLETFKTEGMLMKIFHRIGRIDLNLSELTFKVRPGPDKGCLLDISAHKLDVIGTVRQLLKTSKKLQKLHIPFLLMDFSHMHDISWELPSTMQEMGAQLFTPMMNNQSKFEIRTKFTVKKMGLYGKIFNDLEWVDFRLCVPWLNELEIHSIVNDQQLQAVIQNLPSLNSLTLEKVKGLSDFGISGVHLKVLKKASDQLAKQGVEGLNCAKMPHSGYPLSNITKLRTFICRGGMSITDSAISHGMDLPELEVLEMSGSSLQITDKGLQRLAFSCPKLNSVTLQVSRTSNSLEKIQAFTRSLRFLPNRAHKVELL